MGGREFQERGVSGSECCIPRRFDDECALELEASGSAMAGRGWLGGPSRGGQRSLQGMSAFFLPWGVVGWLGQGATGGSEAIGRGS